MFRSVCQSDDGDIQVIFEPGKPEAPFALQRVAHETGLGINSTLQDWRSCDLQADSPIDLKFSCKHMKCVGFYKDSEQVSLAIDVDGCLVVTVTTNETSWLRFTIRSRLM